MNKTKLIAVVGIAAIMMSLAGCGEKAPSTPYEAYEDTFSAKYFLENNPEYLEDESLIERALEVAADTEAPLGERLKAAELLCEAEFLNAGEEVTLRDNFLYPTYGSVAAQVFAAVEGSDSDEFWAALEDSYATKELMFAAAPYFSPSTALSFYGDRAKAGDLTDMYLSKTVALSMSENTSNLYELAEAMFENGYFTEGSYHNAYDVFVKAKDTLTTVDGSLEYITFFRETALPLLDAHFPDDASVWRKSTTRGGETSYYISPGLRITLSEEAFSPSHIQAAGSGSPAAVPAGKVLAVISNGSQDEYPEAGTDFVLDGDFLLNLPADRMPKTLEEVDYLVAITSLYEHVGEYQSTSGESISEDDPIYAIASYSNITLHDWNTGEQLAFYGTVESDAPSMIMVSSGNKEGRKYAFASHPNEKDVYAAIEAYI